jgi:hypothetical protein
MKVKSGYGKWMAYVICQMENVGITAPKTFGTKNRLSSTSNNIFDPFHPGKSGLSPTAVWEICLIVCNPFPGQESLYAFFDFKLYITRIIESLPILRFHLLFREALPDGWPQIHHPAAIPSAGLNLIFPFRPGKTGGYRAPFRSGPNAR